MPDITRRRLVAAGAAVAGGATVLGGGYGGYRLVRDSPDANFESWAPEPGTWPLERYDPANTSHNPHARPPRETPEKRELASVTYDGERPIRLDPLAGPDHLAVYGVRLAAVTEEGTTAYRESEARHAGFDPDGHLYAVRRNGSDTTITVYDGLAEAHRYPIPFGPRGLTVGRGTAYVPTRHGGVVAYDRIGGRDWTVEGEETALADGHLYAVDGPDGTLAYREREAPERWVSAGPERVWTGPRVGYATTPPAVADGRLVVGTFRWNMLSGTQTDDGADTVDQLQDTSALVALDAETGELLWDPVSFGDDHGDWVDTPAVAGRDGYVTVHSEDTGENFVARYDLETGEEVWRDDTDWIVYDPVLGGGQTLVVAGSVGDSAEEKARMVRAYDAASGDELWTVTFPERRSTGLALVGERVLATYGSSLYELA